MDQPKNKDHRQIGQELELFFTNDIAPGAPFWLPRGMIIFKELEKYIRELTSKAGYQETSTPIMIKSEMLSKSGHYEKFGEHNMYNLSVYEDEEIDAIWNEIKAKETDIKKVVRRSTLPMFPYRVKVKEITYSPLIIVNNKTTGDFTYTLPFNYSLKPMNCPESTIIYSFRTRSYKELPLRLSEIGRLHRREKSGEVNGLLRVRQITMDDAHVYATESQIIGEVTSMLNTMIAFYKSFEFDFEFKLATRPETFAGTIENWKKAEKNLEEALKINKINYTVKEKDGAFYGPKIDMHIKDALGRDWQLATVQLDFYMPQAFDLKYINEKGKVERPVMIHRAIFGSFERFIAILTEHYQGAFPLWLAPVQVMIMPITDKQESFAKKIVEDLKAQGIRAELDNRPERLQAKIRDGSLQKVPYLGIIGNREIKNSKLKIQNCGGFLISVRTREGKDLGQMSLSDLLNKLKEEIDKKI